MSRIAFRKIVVETGKRYFSVSCAQNQLLPECTLKRTKLYDFHVAKGGKMVPFAGWKMPVQYDDLSIIASHHHTREHASLFDVSHMLQFKIHGKDRVKCLEELVVADVQGTPENSGGLSLFMNENGGIIDDCIINNAGDHLYVVSNAGCAHKVRPLMEANEAKWKGEEKDVALEFLDDMSLLALQGPKAAQILQNGVMYDLTAYKFMDALETEIFGVPGCRITRCGYTGEDGLELRIPSYRVQRVAETLLSIDEGVVKFAGLGARDTLRLEAGLCLYGNDMEEHITPVEATLVWTIGKRRRANADFPGAEIVLKQIKEKPTKKRVGIISEGAPARQHAVIANGEGEAVGEVTSGCPSPSVGKNIAMAYVPLGLSKVGTPLKIQRGKKLHDCQVVKMPFHPTKYVF